MLLGDCGLWQGHPQLLLDRKSPRQAAKVWVGEGFTSYVFTSHTRQNNQQNTANSSPGIGVGIRGRSSEDVSTKAWLCLGTTLASPCQGVSQTQRKAELL